VDGATSAFVEAEMTPYELGNVKKFATPDAYERYAKEFHDRQALKNEINSNTANRTVQTIDWSSFPLPRTTHANSLTETMARDAHFMAHMKAGEQFIRANFHKLRSGLTQERSAQTGLAKEAPVITTGTIDGGLTKDAFLHARDRFLERKFGTEYMETEDLGESAEAQPGRNQEVV
jgi:hypothetical protein